MCNIIADRVIKKTREREFSQEKLSLNMLNAEYDISECAQHTFNAKCSILTLNYALVLYLICCDCASKPIHSITERIWFHFRVDGSGWVFIFRNNTLVCYEYDEFEI